MWSFSIGGSKGKHFRFDSDLCSVAVKLGSGSNQNHPHLLLSCRFGMLHVYSVSVQLEA